MNRPTQLGIASVLAALAIVTGSADAFLLRKSVAGNGGDPSQNGTHRLQGTAGQAGIGVGARTGFTLCSGYWCTGGAPTLAVDPTLGPEIPRELSLGPPSPNPSTGNLRMRLALPKPARVELNVFDVGGRQVGDASRFEMVAGYHDLSWRAPTGRAGVYFVRIAVDGAIQAQRRIVIVR